MILKYASSEISIIKEADVSNISYDAEIPMDGNKTYFLPGWKTGTISRTSVIGNPQIILVITDIVSHKITLNSEQLVCKINRSLIDPNQTISDNINKTRK